MSGVAEAAAFDSVGEGYEEDGDVVAAAVEVGGVDEGLAGGGEVGFGGRGRDVGEDGGDVGVGELTVEAVGGEEVEVAGLGSGGTGCRRLRRTGSLRRG